MKSFLDFAEQRKYELLLFALIQHLYIGIVLQDLDFYLNIAWPINMIILGLASVGLFLGKKRWKKWVRNLLLILVLFFPISLAVVGIEAHYMQVLSISYTVFFVYIFFEVMRFLVKPGYINTDIISAAACGYFLLIEITVFFTQFLFYNDPSSFNGLSTDHPTEIYIDLVYFSTIALTTIGFGDITPAAHHTKLIVALIGTIGQLYTVVLIGILISKFASSNTTED